VVVPLPGVLLTNDLFAESRCLATTLGARAVDEKLGQMAAMSAAKLSDAAEQLAEGLSARHGRHRRAVLVGHSYGGYAALEFVHRWPDRVAGLVLISTQCRADTPGATARREKQIALLNSRGLGTVLDGLMPSLVSRASLANPSVPEALRSMAHTVGAETFERQVRACAARADHRVTLRQIPKEIPLLLITGREDKLTPPSCLREMKEILVKREEDVRAAGVEHSHADAGSVAPWRSSLCEGSGHLVPLEQPESFRRALSSWAAEVRSAQVNDKLRTPNMSEAMDFHFSMPVG